MSMLSILIPGSIRNIDIDKCKRILLWDVNETLTYDNDYKNMLLHIQYLVVIAKTIFENNFILPGSGNRCSPIAFPIAPRDYMEFISNITNVRNRIMLKEALLCIRYLESIVGMFLMKGCMTEQSNYWMLDCRDANGSFNNMMTCLLRRYGVSRDVIAVITDYICNLDSDIKLMKLTNIYLT